MLGHLHLLLHSSDSSRDLLVWNDLLDWSGKHVRESIRHIGLPTLIVSIEQQWANESGASKNFDRCLVRLQENFIPLLWNLLLFNSSKMCVLSYTWAAARPIYSNQRCDGFLLSPLQSFGRNYTGTEKKLNHLFISSGFAYHTVRGSILPSNRAAIVRFSCGIVNVKRVCSISSSTGKLTNPRWDKSSCISVYTPVGVRVVLSWYLKSPSPAISS